MVTINVPDSLGGISLARKWKESDLKIGCRLLPGRDDDILEFFSKIGRYEKSYKIREALRMYIKAESGVFTTPANPVIKERWLPPQGDSEKVITVARELKNIPPPVTAKIDVVVDGEEPSPEAVEANLATLIEGFN